MADDVSQIAHLFLSERARPCGGLMVRAVLAEHLADSQNVVRSVAEHMARQMGSVGLLDLQRDSPVLELLSTEGSEVDGESADCCGDKGADLGQVLSELPNHTNMLLIGLKAESPLLSHCREISVAICADSSAVVGSYSQLKQLAAEHSEALGITVVGCSTIVQGEALAERLCQTAKEFLAVPVKLHAIVLRDSRIQKRKLALAQEVDQGELGQVISSLRQC